MKRNSRKKVHYGRYPYAVTRAKAMKSLLLTKDDYTKIHNMQYSEIARYLEEGTYKEEITKLSGIYEGIELIEQALNENLATIVNKKIRNATKPELTELIERYALKWVTNNFKLLLKLHCGIIDKSQAEAIFIPIKPTTKEVFEELLSEDQQKIITIISSHLPVNKKRLVEILEEKNILDIENELDRAFFAHITELLERQKESPIQEFFKTMVTLTNIKTVVRMKSRDISQEKIEKRLIGKELHTRLIKDLLASQSLDTCFDILQKSRYKTLITDDVKKDLSLLENHSEKFLYSYAFLLLHKHPLSVGPIFGYLLLKEIEVRNLRIYVHAKAQGLGEEFITENVVM